MNTYYKIWVDAIVKIKSNPLRKEDWKWMIQSIVATLMSLNLMLIQFFLSDLGLIKTVFVLDINWLPIGKLNNIISFFIAYLIPLLLLNYFLIFHNDKYKKLIEIYPHKNGKWFATYLFCSTGFFILYFLIAFLFWVG